MKSKVKVIVKINFILDFSFKFKCNIIMKLWFEITSVIQIKLVTKGDHSKQYFIQSPSDGFFAK